MIPISDARIVARYADATLLVARAGAATRRQVRAAVERLELISVKPTAACSTTRPRSSRSSYYVRPNESDVEHAPRPPLRQEAARRRQQLSGLQCSKRPA